MFPGIIQRISYIKSGAQRREMFLVTLLGIIQRQTYTKSGAKRRQFLSMFSAKYKGNRKSGTKAAGLFEDPFLGKNSKGTLHTIWREAPERFLRVFVANIQVIVYQIRREAPASFCGDLFWAQYQGSPT